MAIKVSQKAYKISKIQKFSKALKRKCFSIREILRNKRTPYTLNFPYPYIIYSPWFEDSFLKLYDKIKKHTLVTEDRCYMIRRFCQHGLHLEGDFAECGVFQGGTAILIAETIKNSDNSHAEKKGLYLFDTFEGMPATTDKQRDGHVQGDFSNTSLAEVKDRLDEYSFAEIYPGLIPETLSSVDNKQFSFVHIDVDIYPATFDCMNFFYTRMVKGGIMLCGDYGFFAYKDAAKAAVEDFFRDKPELPIALHTGQCVIIKK